MSARVIGQARWYSHKISYRDGRSFGGSRDSFGFDRSRKRLCLPVCPCRLIPASAPCSIARAGSGEDVNGGAVPSNGIPSMAQVICAEALCMPGSLGTRDINSANSSTLSLMGSVRQQVHLVQRDRPALWAGTARHRNGAAAPASPAADRAAPPGEIERELGGLSRKIEVGSIKHDGQHHWHREPRSA
jgi:hypothetical protein